MYTCVTVYTKCALVVKIITPRAHAQSGVKQLVLSVSLSSKFWPNHDNEGSEDSEHFYTSLKQ